MTHQQHDLFVSNSRKSAAQPKAKRATFSMSKHAHQNDPPFRDGKRHGFRDETRAAVSSGGMRLCGLRVISQRSPYVDNWQPRMPSGRAASLIQSFPLARRSQRSPAIERPTCARFPVESAAALMAATVRVTPVKWRGPALLVTAASP